MNITLSVDTYKGVDGSSLSPTRCNQIVQVYEMLELFGDKPMTYIKVQEEAEKRKLFGETNAKSARATTSTKTMVISCQAPASPTASLQE